MEISTLTFILITIVTFLYLYIRRCYNYWKDRNVVYLEPSFLYGNFKDLIKNKAPLTDVTGEIYNKVKAQGKDFGGIYSMFSPQLVAVNLDLLKSIMQTNFSHFMNIGLYYNEEKEPLTAHLVNLENERWKNLRAKLTPTFTTGSIKAMFQTLVACTGGLEKLLKTAADNKNGIDIRDILGRFTIDVIGSVGFGVSINSMENPESEFRKYGLQMVDINTPETKNFLLLSFLPRWFAKLLNLRTMSKDMESFFMNLVKDTVSYRERNNIYRKDFLQSLIQLKNLGEVTSDEDKLPVGKSINKGPGLTLNEIAAQCFMFFIGGFDTSSATMSYALLELSQRQDIQQKLREEINRVLEKYGNKLTYEAIMEMEYLEKVVLETLRMHPPFPISLRACNKDYKVPNGDLVIEAGITVNIPIFAIHRDPDHFPEPNRFDPERFSEENKAKRHPMAYLPFGEGPRMCIGMRWGKLQSKVGLIHVLKNYKVTLHEKTALPIKYEMGFGTSVKGGLWVNLEPIC